MIMVNHKVVAPDAILHDGDEVMLLQILGGG
jgi:sulfur carrier protein ThiS